MTRCKKITPRKKRNARSPKLQVEHLPPSSLKPDPRNARRHTDRQIHKLARIIREMGWSNPIVIDEVGMILAGHARLVAAQLLGRKVVPCVRLAHLTVAQKTALAIADNKLSDESTFDDAALRAVLIELANLDFDLELTGFDMGEIDFLIDGPGSGAADPADTFDGPDHDRPAVSRLGDLWFLDKHRLLCGNALEASAYEQLLGPDRAQMVFTDVPYNVKVSGHVSGLGRHTHREFAMASGEMSGDEYLGFLATAMTQMADHSADGSIHYHCIDWRHLRTMLEAGDGPYAKVVNLCVWAKTNAGMGSLYRSQHELVVVFKKGEASHRNNVELGRYGRWRSNLWTYPGANTFGPNRDTDLAAHPTVKPVALVADSIRDVSKRRDIVLDPFVGSGTTILAAERTGRRAAAIEIDSLYIDVAVRRWQAFTGKTAVLAGDGRSFEEIRVVRVGDDDIPSNQAEGGL